LKEYQKKFISSNHKQLKGLFRKSFNIQKEDIQNLCATEKKGTQKGSFKKCIKMMT
jgi:hypothetical protein